MIQQIIQFKNPSLYVHIPFCVSKCSYCDFNSHAGDGQRVDDYVDALAVEISTHAARRPPTLFVGGGTPTWLSTNQLRRVFEALERAGAFEDPLVEVTVEANPESATREKLELLRSLGVNRISLGVQSFDSSHLKAFDRVHSVDDVDRAINNIKSAGFARFNLDLIFAKPGQTLDHWECELDRALQYQPDHLSCYELAFEPGTALRRSLLRGRVEPIDQDDTVRFYHSTISTLESRGFHHYEISAFARPGSECRHNMVYWLAGDWIGVGAGAGSRLQNRTFLNIHNPTAYLEAIHMTGSACDPATVEAYDDAGLRDVLFMMGLRILTGFPLALFELRTGSPLPNAYFLKFEELQQKGLIAVSDGWIALTPRGRDVANHVVGELML